MEPIYAAIGSKIERIRSERGLSQAELGQKLSPPLTRAAICNIERARQRLLIHVLLDLGRVLGVSPLDLLSSEFQQIPAKPSEAPRKPATVREDLPVEWAVRKLACGVTEYRRPVGTEFDLLVEDDPATGIHWQVNVQGNHLLLGETITRRRGPLRWLILEAMRTCADAARRAGLAVDVP